VECSFGVDLIEVVADDSGGWSGTATGEVFRNLYSGEQRFEFSALIGGPATFTATGSDAVELRAVGDQTGAKPFWRELEVLQGTRTAELSYAGSWICGSLELAEPGFPDVGHSAPGSWTLVPAQ
jgi:hypothetical protein